VVLIQIPTVIYGPLISAVSDAMNKLGMESACFGVAPLDSAYSMVGRAFTVKYEACGVEKGAVGDYNQNGMMHTLVKHYKYLIYGLCNIKMETIRRGSPKIKVRK
jgi:hypothetical protein